MTPDQIIPTTKQYSALHRISGEQHVDFNTTEQLYDLGWIELSMDELYYVVSAEGYNAMHRYESPPAT